MWEEMVKVDGPYHFDLALSRLSMDPLHIVDREGRTVKVPIYGTTPEVATVKAIGTTEEPAFLVTGFDALTKESVLEKISFIFQWNVSLKNIHEHFKQTTLKNLFNIHRGTPVILDFSLYSNLVKSIIHQQINMTFAISLTEQFVKTFGFQLEGVPFYPTPRKVAKLEMEQLRQLKFSQRKAEYIIDLSKQLVKGQLNLEKIILLPDEDIIKELVKIRGIGPWTAQNFLLFGLGRPNLFPSADIGIQKAIKILFQLERKPTIEEIHKYSTEWQPYLSYASLYLWRSIEPLD
ncbi:DNA-3-methyladenine glycosylase family protein [Lederbergia lenta]|uniref:DNA-3-methyladenine glycosylase family protein n=1 Tax=Lederbergia lenta TaxID=1467 RepID=UPI0020407F79|nr:DNA-3-methyladenine glycosylase [Lederbergia lenta]MCM3111041.1 DNA-3-methyladenine glycosylase [Lederbergia lenta]